MGIIVSQFERPDLGFFCEKRLIFAEVHQIRDKLAQKEMDRNMTKIDRKYGRGRINEVLQRRRLTGEDALAEALKHQGSSLEGSAVNLQILQKIPTAIRDRQLELADSINSLLAGKGAKSAKKAFLKIDTGTRILQSLDPTYVRPESGSFAQETQKVVNKVVEATLPKEIIQKALNGDPDSQMAVADKIRKVYEYLESSRKVHGGEIRESTRNLLGPFFRGKQNREQRRGLTPIKRLGAHHKFEKLHEDIFNPKVPKTKEGEAEAKDYHVDRAWKPESKLGKIAYYGPVVPWLAHRLALRPTKLILKKTVVQPAKWVYRKLIKPPYEFLLNQTIRKGPWVTAGRLTLWIGGSTLTGGLPIIPAAVETALWAANKVRKNKTVRKVAHESKEIAQDVAFVGALGIPHAAIGIVKDAGKIRELRKAVTRDKKNEHRKAA